jgi:anti-sigma factor RsiW
MDCNESQSLMTAYIDGELDSSHAVLCGAHIENCAACDETYRQMRDVRSTVRQHAVFHPAPAHLRQRILASLPQPSVPAVPQKKTASKWSWSWLNFGFAGTAAMACAFMMSVYLQAPSLQDRIEDEVLASHARSLMVNHLSDVISTDQHTVKPWFAGKLDFSPTVIDFAPQGYALIGGRLDYVDKRPVAAMAYRHRLHVINLFVWPQTANNMTPDVAAEKQGFNMLHWTQSGMCYWLISDMNAQDLTEFKQLLNAQVEGEHKS